MTASTLPVTMSSGTPATAAATSASTAGLVLRPLAAEDSIEALTALLHASYASLAAQGWNFTAVDQSVQTTRERVAAGQAFVALTGEGALVGTVTIAPPKRPDGRYLGDPVPDCYTRADTAILAQLAVHPACRGQGVAERLMDLAEGWARMQGYAHVALDTAVPAEALRRRYERRGYALIGDVQWAGKTYRSVLMRKALGDVEGSTATAAPVAAAEAAAVAVADDTLSREGQA